MRFHSNRFWEKETGATFALALGGPLLMFFLGCGPKQGGAGGGGGFQMPPSPVEVATITSGVVSDRFEAVGTIEAGEEITVVSEVDGIVARIAFSEGASVRKGDLLIQLDDVQRKAEMDRAEAVRDQRKSSFERVRSIVDQGAGAEQDLDDAAAALKVSEADFQLARSAYMKTRITAPWDGDVGAKRVSPGAFVRSGEELTDLTQLRRVRVRFSAPERYLARLTKGSPVLVSTTAYLGMELTGNIDLVEPMLDPATRSARIMAVVDNVESRFRPGMSCNVSAVLSQREHALTVPSEAVFVEGNETLVYKVQADSTVARVPIQLGTRLVAVVEVVSGLAEGDRVVRAGHQKLYPGAKVLPIESAAPVEEAGSASGGTSGGDSSEGSGQ